MIDMPRELLNVRIHSCIILLEVATCWICVAFTALYVHQVDVNFEIRSDFTSSSAPCFAWIRVSRVVALATLMNFLYG